MAYEPTEWHTGDTITEEKLNKIEQGIDATNGLLYFDNGTGSLGVSYSDIATMLDNGVIPFFIANGNLVQYVGGGQYSEGYATSFFVIVDSDEKVFMAQNADDPLIWLDPDAPAPDDGGGGTDV